MKSDTPEQTGSVFQIWYRSEECPDMLWKVTNLQVKSKTKFQARRFLKKCPQIKRAKGLNFIICREDENPNWYREE